MPRQHLIICCAGDDSLHPSWIHPDRTYDVCVIYYGTNNDVATKYKSEAEYFFQRTGYKFGLLRDCIIPHYENHRELYAAYEFIWIPDDDISMEPNAINKMFELSRNIGADIFQPSLANFLKPAQYNRVKQWISWLHTATNIKSKYRRINHPEIMMPGFSAHAFQHILLKSLHDYPSVVVGWGIDEYWEKLWKSLHPNEPNRIYIYDVHFAFHTKPVSLGSSIHAIGYEEIKLYPFKTTQTKTLEVFN